MNAGLNLILTASAALFAVGAFAVVARRSAVLMLIGTQFMFFGGSIAFVAFARFGLGAAHASAGAAVAIFAGATAVAELAVGLTELGRLHDHRTKPRPLRCGRQIAIAESDLHAIDGVGKRPAQLLTPGFAPALEKPFS